MNDPTDGASIDLYWLPLGAGGRSVRWNGRIYEASAAALGRRPARDLYHSALVVMQRGDSYVVEMAPVWATNGENRGVVCVGPVGARWLGRYRAFCYEVRCWRDGYIPDVAAAVDSPQRVSNSPDQVAGLFDVVRLVPSLTWGRDEIGSSEMWNSNSLVSWLLAETGLDMTAIHPPAGGRAPGWHAGLALAAAPLAARRSIRVSRRGLAAFAGVIALSAYLGALGLILGFLNLGAVVAGRLPWHSPVFGGLALAALVAMPCTVLAWFAAQGDRRTDAASVIVGVLIIGWILVELAFIRQLSMFHPTYVLVGFALILLGSRRHSSKTRSG
jgi:hypothetical protein